jgi:lysophospholipase L1-like esterase
MISGASLLITTLAVEYLFFRYILLASDLPQPVFINQVIKYRPLQSGVYRVGDEIAAPFHINQQGWNSAHLNYQVASQDVETVVVIGDSYVDALQVDYKSSFAEVLENRLITQNLNDEEPRKQIKVYRMGISGAPLSQYYHLLRKEAKLYQPKLVIISLIHNDFTESFTFTPGMYSSSFLKIKRELDQFQLIEPTTYQRMWYTSLRESATWRYLAFRKGLRFALLRRVVFGEEDKIKVGEEDTGSLSHETHEVTNFLFAEIKKLADAEGIKLLFIIDGDRQRIYGVTGREKDQRSIAAINQMASDLAKANKIPFLDLTQVFEEDYRRNRKAFNSQVDYHWNEYGHRLVGETIAEKLNSYGSFE